MRLRRWILEDFHGRRSERGQFLIMFIAVFSVILIAGAFALDQGLWQNKRRDAQKDADAAARAGASRYIQSISDGETPGSLSSASFSEASARALQLATKNLAPAPTAEDVFASDGCAQHTVTTCMRQSCPTTGSDINHAPSIEVAVRRPAPGLFLKALGAFSNQDNIGAKSTACVGSVKTIGPNPIGAIPIELFNTDFDPAFNDCYSAAPPPAPGVENNLRVGMQCVIKSAAKGTHNGGDRGFIRARMNDNECTGGGGANDVRSAIEDGLTFTCSIDTDNVCSVVINSQDCVADKPGNVASTLSNWNARLTGAGAIPQTCGAGTFKETFTYGDGSAIPAIKVGPPGLNNPPNTVNGSADAPGTAYAEKACTNPRVAIVILTDDTAQHVKGFAGVFIVGCFDEGNTTLSNTLNKCESSLGIANGHEEIRAVLLRLILTDGAVGGIGDPSQDKTSPLAIETTQ